MIDAAEQITRRTFLRHVDRQQLDTLTDLLGYVQHPSQGLTLAQDRAVGYYRSRLHGQRVYFFRWSAIEYVFAQESPWRCVPLEVLP